MSDIKFYDFDFNLLHIEPFAESENYTVKFCGEGSFELHFAGNFENKREFTESLNIKDGKGICIKAGNRSGIVTGIRIDNDFAIYGKSCDFILKKKIVLPFENLRIYTPSELCSHFLNSAFSDTESVVMKSFDGETGTFTEAMTQEHPATLYNTIYDILSAKDLGYAMNFNTSLKKWEFEIIKPSLTEKKFICDSATSYDIKLSYDIKKYFSHTLTKNAAGDYEFVQKNVGTGLYRWEEISETDEMLYDLELKFMKDKFEKDYFLGDKFKIFTENGTFSVMVTEVFVSREGDTEKQIPKLKILKEAET